MKTKTIFLFFAVVLLSACTTTIPAPAPKEDAESAQMLSSAISRVAAAPASTTSADAKAVPAQMAGGRITVNFAGEAKDLLRQMASPRTVEYKVRGPQPHLPLFVIVDVKNVTFEEFLTDVGSQFGQRADLVLTNKSIEVRYRDQ